MENEKFTHMSELEKTILQVQVAMEKLKEQIKTNAKLVYEEFEDEFGCGGQAYERLSNAVDVLELAQSEFEEFSRGLNTFENAYAKDLNEYKAVLGSQGIRYLTPEEAQ